MTEVPVCPVCKQQKNREVLTAKDYTVSKEQFTIRHCDNCSFRFTWPVPSQDEIGKYYKSEDYISHSDSQKGFINSVYQKVRSRTLKNKLKLIRSKTGKKAGSLLDIGAGTGYFLNTVKEAGWNVTGLEPDEGARQMAKKNFGIELLPLDQLDQLPKASFDAITLWHVLEHVHELDHYMERLHELLKDEGVLFVAVPNYDSKDANTYESGWAAYDVPRHLYHFNPRSMNFLLVRSQFELKSMHRMPYDSFYVSMLSEKYRGGGMFKAMWNGFRSWMAARSKKERCSSLIYVAKKQLPR